MDCFNHSCPFRVNETSNVNRCECVACQNRNNNNFIIASNRTFAGDGEARRGVETCIAVLESEPTVDAVEIVRCKDCIRRYDTDECPMCFLSGGRYYEFTQDDGFCNRGERKDNG